MTSSRPESAFKTALPVIFGYVPVAITFGLLAAQQKAGLAMALALSAFVYAGAAQFIALALLASGATGFVSTFVTIGLVNLRHVILGLSYFPSTRAWTMRERIRFFPFLTDETYAVLMGTKELRRNPREAWTVALMSYGAWFSGTVIGFFSGELVPDPRKLGLDFALQALFIGIIVLFVKKRSHVVSLVGALAFSVLFYFVMDLGKNSLLVAAVLGSGLGWFVERRFEARA